MAKINGNEIKPGMVLEHDGGLWAAVKVNHVKPGKGGAFAQAAARALLRETKLTPREIELLKQWVKSGGKYTKHWSYEKPQRPALPPRRPRILPRQTAFAKP